MAEILKFTGENLSSKEKARLFNQIFAGTSPRGRTRRQDNKQTDSKDRGHHPHTTAPKPI